MGATSGVKYAPNCVQPWVLPNDKMSHVTSASMLHCLETLSSRRASVSQSFKLPARLKQHDSTTRTSARRLFATVLIPWRN